MEINVVLDYFGKLNDENAMVVEFKDGGHVLVDNSDIVCANGDLIEIESNMGCYITEASNISGLRIMPRVALMGKVLLEKILEEEGDE